MKKRVFSLFVAIVMLVSTFGYMPVVAADASYLAFTSDIHNTGAATSNDTGANNLTNWLANIPGKIGGTFEVMGFCGDNGDSNTNGDTYWSRVQTVMDVVDGSDKVAESIFINGNHEHQNGSQSSSSNATAKKIKGIGYTKEATDYIIYVFGAASQSQSFNQSDITNLDNYLMTVDSAKPVFIMSHFPLHYDSDRKTSNAQALLDVLNKYPNVIFLWGHNHTNSDSHYDEVYLAGDTIKLTSSGSEKEINFTYAAAGCMGNNSYAHAVQADGLVAKVDGSAVTLTYYSGTASVVGTSVTVDVSTGTGIETPTPDPDPTPDAPVADGTFTKVTSIENGKTYVIVAENMGMNATAHNGYTNKNSYSYSGFAGTSVTASNNKITSKVTEDMLWTAESVSGGFAFKNASNGKYLSAFYVGRGDNGIEFSTTAQAWTLSSSKLKSVAASSSADSDKFLAWDKDSDVDGGLNVSGASGTANLFTVRSNDNADNVTLYVANGDVTDVPGGNEGGENTDPDRPGGNEGGENTDPDRPGGNEGGENTDPENGTTTKVNVLEDGKTYIIASNGYAMKNNNGEIQVVTFDANNITYTSDMLWTAEKNGNGYKLKNGSYYLDSTTHSQDKARQPVLSNSGHAWSYDGTYLVTTVSNTEYCIYVTVSNTSSTEPAFKMYNEKTGESSHEAMLYSVEAGAGEGGNPPVEPEVPVYKVSGTVTSFYGETDNVTVALLNGDNEVVYSTTVTGNNATYTINNVAAGEYTLRVSNTANVTRVYEVVVVDADVTQDAELYMLGDANGDGKVNVGDYNAVYYHTLDTALITDEFALMCADVNGDGSITPADANMIFNHALGKTYLW